MKIECLVNGNRRIVGRDDRKTTAWGIIESGDTHRARVGSYIDAIIAWTHEAAELRHHIAAPLRDARGIE